MDFTFPFSEWGVLRPKAAQCLLVLSCLSCLFCLLCLLGLLRLFVWFVCTFLEKGKQKSIGESMALHSSAAPCYGASAIAGACGAQVLALWFVCLSVCPSVVRPLSSCLFSSSSLGFGCSSQFDHVCGLAGAALSAQGPPCKGSSA